jgi:hypothetical protein
LIPNTTQIPNFLLDRILPVVQPAAWKVISFVCRKTFGWQKRQDRISLSQFERGTGLSRRHLVPTLLHVTNSGLLIKLSSPSGDVYALDIGCDVEAVVAALTGAISSPVQSVHQCTEDTISGEVSTPKLVNSVHTQKPNKPTPTKPKRKNSTSAPFDSLPDWITKDKTTQEAWDGFIEHRKASKTLFGKRAADLLLAKLQQLKDTGNDPAEVLNTSVMNGWRGVFPLKENGNGNDGRQAGNPADARQQRIIHRARTVSAISENLGRTATDPSAGDGGGRAAVLDGHTLSVSR